MFDVTKHFVSGPLKGLTITERTSVRFVAGPRVYRPCAGASAYRVTACVEVLS